MEIARSEVHMNNTQWLGQRVCIKPQKVATIAPLVEEAMVCKKPAL